MYHFKKYGIYSSLNIESYKLIANINCTVKIDYNNCNLVMPYVIYSCCSKFIKITGYCTFTLWLKNAIKKYISFI